MLANLTEAKKSDIVYIDVNKIRANPHQPRQEMDVAALKGLSDSIRQYGLMQPIVLREINFGEYELIAGERRLRACKNIGYEKIASIIIRATGTDSAVMALIENIQRENLGYIEEAEAYSSLINEHGITQDELAERVGKNQSTIANKIRILKLSPEIRRLLAENKLTERHARALLKLADDKSRMKALKIIISRGLNVGKTDELVENMLKEPETKVKQHNIRVIKDIRIFSNTIRQAVDMMVQSGIEARSQKIENEEYIEYNIKIPKKLKSSV